MSSVGKEPLENIRSPLEEALGITDELCRLEGEMAQMLLSMNLRGLAATEGARSEILCQGSRLIGRIRKGKGQSRATGDRAQQQKCYEILEEKLLAIRARQEVNRCLLEAGAPAISRVQKILAGGKATYDHRGEMRNFAAGSRANLDQNC